MNQKELANAIISAFSAPVSVWVLLTIVSIVVFAIVALIKFNSIVRFFFGNKEGILEKPEQKKEIDNVDANEQIVEKDSGSVWHYIKGKTYVVIFNESVKISPLEDLEMFIVKLIKEIEGIKTSQKKLVLDFTETQKINSTAIKDIINVFDYLFSKESPVEIEVIVSKDPSEQVKEAKEIWSALIASQKIKTGEDPNVRISYKQ